MNYSVHSSAPRYSHLYILINSSNEARRKLLQAGCGYHVTFKQHSGRVRELMRLVVRLSVRKLLPTILNTVR